MEQRQEIDRASEWKGFSLSKKAAPDMQNLENIDKSGLHGVSEINHEHGRTVRFYFMVNAGSGGKQAPLLTNLSVEEIEFQNYVSRKGSLKNLNLIKVKITPLNEADQRMTIMAQINLNSKIKSSPSKIYIIIDGLNIYVIACGGDGTTIWVIEELIKAKVNIANVIVGVLPLGTGNDYSIATGFGCRLPL